MNKNKIKAVIFDMDGVIIDSEPLQSLSWEKLLLEKGIKPIFNKNGLIHEIGPVDEEAHRKILNRHNLQEDLTVIKQRRRELFLEVINKKLIPVPGFCEFMNLLKQKRIKTAVASNRSIDHIYIMLNNLGVKHLFKVIVGPSPDRKWKPAPDIFLHAAKTLRIKPENCLVIEDSETGIVAGKKAGMKVIAIRTKWTIGHNLSQADKIINGFSEMTIDLIKNL